MVLPTLGLSELQVQEIVKTHVPHPNSLLSSKSSEAFNDEAARRDFGDDHVNLVKDYHERFKGDIWQLCFLGWVISAPTGSFRARAKIWNEWRKAQPKRVHAADHEFIHLERVTLADLKILGLNLDAARLDNARCSGVTMRRVHLVAAQMDHVFLDHAKLQRVRMRGANLTGACLFRARCKNVVANGAHFTGAIMERAVFRRSYFDGARFDHASAMRCKFLDSSLQGCTLNLSRLSGASLEGSDLRRAIGLILDENRIRGTRFSSNASDPWSLLRRKYSGPWYFVHLLLLVAFLTPRAAEATYLTVLARLEPEILDTWLLKSAINDPSYSAQLRSLAEANLERQHALGILLGWYDGYIALILAVVLVAYNALRAFLTIKVGEIRDAEERSEISPAAEEYSGICHPASGFVEGWLRLWWKSHAQFREPNLGPPQKRWLSHPVWLVKLADTWPLRLNVQRRPLPFSLLQTMGLYRLHKAAQVMFWIVISFFFMNACIWLRDAWVWVPR